MIVANFLLAHFSGTPLWCLCKCVVLVFLIIGFCKSKKCFISRNQLIITPPICKQTKSMLCVGGDEWYIN